MPNPDFELTVPNGDDRTRRVCTTCGFIDYVNPKIVVGAVAAASDGRLVLCRRAIEPRKGYWTIPAGFLEEGESTEAGAAREAYEEARARLAIDQLLAVYSIPRISQVQLIYRASLTEDHVEAGPESADVALVAYADIPWADLAFPSVHWALEQYQQVRGQAAFAPFANPRGALGDRLPQGL
ncbi:MAG: NUDIX domain-containing protein [Rhodothalassiaceae bacterium]